MILTEDCTLLVGQACLMENGMASSSAQQKAIEWLPHQDERNRHERNTERF